MWIYSASLTLTPLPYVQQLCQGNRSKNIWSRNRCIIFYNSSSNVNLDPTLMERPFVMKTSFSTPTKDVHGVLKTSDTSTWQLAEWQLTYRQHLKIKHWPAITRCSFTFQQDSAFCSLAIIECYKNDLAFCWKNFCNCYPFCKWSTLIV